MARQLPRGNWGLWAWNFLGPGRPGLILEKTRLQSYLHWNRCFFEFKDWDVVLEASLLWKVYMAAVTDSGGHSDIWIRFSFSSCLWPPQVPFLQQPGRPSPVNTFEHGLDRFEQIWTDLNMVFQMFDLIWSHCEVPLSAASCELRAYEVITLTCATGCSTDTMARHSTGATESVSRKTSVTSVTSVSDSNWLGVLNVLRARGEVWKDGEGSHMIFFDALPLVDVHLTSGKRDGEGLSSCHQGLSCHHLRQHGDGWKYCSQWS